MTLLELISLRDSRRDTFKASRLISTISNALRDPRQVIFRFRSNVPLPAIPHAHPRHGVSLAISPPPASQAAAPPRPGLLRGRRPRAQLRQALAHRCGLGCYSRCGEGAQAAALLGASPAGCLSREQPKCRGTAKSLPQVLAGCWHFWGFERAEAATSFAGGLARLLASPVELRERCEKLELPRKPLRTARSSCAER